MALRMNVSRPRLITLQQAAELLNVRPQTVMSWIKRDSIPYVQLPTDGQQQPVYRIPLQGLLNSLSGNYDLASAVAEPTVVGASDAPNQRRNARPDPPAIDEVTGTLDASGEALWPGDEALAPIISSVRTVTSDLLDRLARSPGLVQRLHWRTFEELVAELFSRQGWEVELTAPSKDGGADLYAARHDGFGRVLYVVECKKYSPERPIGPHLVRALYGVVERQRATRGVLATTSLFTPGAEHEAELLHHRIALSDVHDVNEWIRGSARRPENSV